MGLRSWGDVRQVLGAFWSQPSPGEGLRNACATAIQIASMFRDNVRSLRLNDLSHLPMDAIFEDRDPYAHLPNYTNRMEHQAPSIPEGTRFAVFITTSKGQNQSCMRHRDVQACPIAHLGAFLFWRYAPRTDTTTLTTGSTSAAPARSSQMRRSQWTAACYRRSRREKTGTASSSSASPRDLVAPRTIPQRIPPKLFQTLRTASL